ncbi:MAG: hypothetical protein GBAus27B_000233 [Mycoplasmataceae bacterium]|nr:MAG: hypothetical protein GBAus27B_000233 [Mycoplasmataceae bacterium]
MNDLLFYAILIALLCYFFIYLPKNKQKLPASVTKPTANSDNSELAQALTALLHNLQTLNQTI